MNKIKRMVQNLIQTYGTSDPFLLCRALGFPVLWSKLPEHMKGFCLEVKQKKLIFLNQQLPEPEQKEVCGHELGHALLHSHVNAYFISYHTNLLCAKYEKEADYFCACLLIDDRLLTGGAETVDQVAGVAGVSRELVECALEQFHR